MLFDFKKRGCEFGTFNNRYEREGPETKRKAIDLPLRFPVKHSELDMLAPTQGLALSEFLYGNDLRKPQLQTTLLSPISIRRKPEHVTLIIYDDEIDKRKKLTFTDVRIKDPVLEFDENGIYLMCKAQIHPDGHLQRVSDNVENKTLQFECKATQPELFDDKDEEEEDDEGDDDGQGDLVGHPDGDDDDN